MKLSFTVSGMTCSACSARVEKCVRNVAGVKSCNVNLITGALSVEADSDISELIIKAVKNEGYGIKVGVSLKRGREGEKSLKKRLIISVPLTVILMYISMGPMIGIPVPDCLNMMKMEGMFLSSVVQAALTLAVIIVNFAYYTSGYKKLFGLKPNMDSLVALGSSASFLYGAYVTVMIAVGHFTKNHDLMMKFMDSLYFEGAATILTLITVGKYLEEKSKNKTMSSVEKLLGLAPETAVVLIDGEEKEVKISELKVGDKVVLKDGDRVPCDGKIASGGGWLDQSVITGESVPVYKEIGDNVVTGTTFSGGYCVMEAVSVGEDTTLYKIVKLVEDANSTKVPIAKLADKIAGVFVPVVIGISLLSLAIWLIIGKEFSFAVNIAVSVLVVSCPCALGLATPAALMAGTGKAAEYGILIKSGEALQKTASADVVVLDKTGTITYGKPQVENVEITGKITEAEFLATAVALEKMSSHILGKAVIEYAEKKGVEGYAAENFEAIKGLGIKGVVNGKECLLGNRNFAIGETPEEDGKKLIELAEKEVGATVLFMSIDGEKSGYMSIKDGIKPSSREAIAELKAMNKEVVMLTGDNKSAARAVADELGISYEAEVLPDRKYEVVNALKKDGKTVMMVGDGVNDAPALSAADIGVAIGAGADIAIDSADVVLIKSDLGDVVKTIKTGVKVMRNIKENLFWAFFYNVILIPVACGVLYPVGGEKLLLNPMFASLAMSLSSVCVVGNALRLRFIKFGKSDERAAERNKPKKVEGIKPVEKADNKNVGDGSAKGGEKVETAKMTIYIDGMMCEHCKKRVETALNGIGLTAEVSLQNKCAYITDGEAEDGAIKIAISDAGYSVTDIVR